MMTKDCNNCARNNCPGAKDFTAMLSCFRFLKPPEGFKLVELALTYPTSLNEALSNLPFEIKLFDYLKRKEDRL